MADPWDFGWNQVLTIVGMAITVGIAIGGFKTFGRWKRERIEERKIDIALEALSIAYESKGVFEAIRNPGLFSYEWSDMPRVEGESDSEWEARAPYYVTLKRLDENNEYFRKTLQLQPRFMAVFGPESEKIFDQLFGARVQVLVSAKSLMRQRRRNTKWTEAYEKREAQSEADIWGGDDEQAPQGDRVARQLEAFKSEIIKLCRPVVDRSFRHKQA